MIISEVKEKKTPRKSRSKTGKSARIILFNDHVNTFDHVISCLIDICDHAREQAEQCALITHLKGKCEVKQGSRNALLPICRRLLDSGLTAEVQ